MGKVGTIKHRTSGKNWHSGENNERRGQTGTQKPGLKLIVISGKTVGMTKEGTKIMSIISVAGHQVVKNLSEPSEITLVHLEIYADT